MVKSKIKIKNKNKIIDLKLVNILLYTVFVFCLVFYIAGVNSISVLGFKMYENKQKIHILENENNNLEIKTMSLQSYVNISRRASDLKMVKADKVDYLSSSAGFVAKK